MLCPKLHCSVSFSSAFLNQINYDRLDHYFSLVFQRALLQHEMLKHGAKQTQYIEPFLDSLPAVRGLLLPEETKVHTPPENEMWYHGEKCYQ